MKKLKRKRGKIYKPQGRQFLGLVILVILTVLYFAVTSLIFQSLFILLPVFAFLLFRAFIAATQRSIRIFEDGIEYRYGSSYAFTTWDNVKYVNKLGIALHQAIKPVAEGGFIEKRLFGQKPMSYIPVFEIIPMPTRWLSFKQGYAPDFEKLTKTDFGRDLMHYIPQAFSAYTEYKPKHQLEDDGHDVLDKWENSHGTHKTQTLE